MAISLYDASVPTYLQTVGAASRFLERGWAHFQEHGIDPEEVVESRVFTDMLPFRFQVHSIVHHSVHALEALAQGVFRPGGERPKHDYRGLQALLSEAEETLKKLSPDEINSRSGAAVVFDAGNMKLPFKAENFVLSFSLPNFHFHATTAYGILRAKGVPLGKRDYMGRVRIEQ